MAGFDVLVIGSGGREYELARQMCLSDLSGKVYVTPGNAGTAALDKAENVAIGPTEVDRLAAFARDKSVGLAILGMDSSVEAGVGDALRQADIPVFGPTRAAGKLEWSKAFAADFMSRHDIPQPQSQTAYSLEEALAIVQDKPPQTYVLKADGLAAGKGVVLPESAEQARAVLEEMFAGEVFDGAGKDAVVIQERLHGPELSAFVVTDGTELVLLPLSQDHKRLKDHDEGPNTGGMGSYAPVPSTIVSEVQVQQIQDIAKRTIDNMAADGMPYQGVLYIGLMLAEERGGDPVVIEYNARFGDPEAEILLPVLSESGVDVADMLVQVATGNLKRASMPKALPVAALTVALASTGYPESPRKGDEIFGLDKPYDNVIVQHAGTRQEGGEWLTNGGRVLYVTGLGKTIDEAAARAYGAIGQQGVHFKGMQHRSDIGWQARKK